ncbi:MAG: TRAP transporter permease, partial [Betaproteobacteria bacterium]
FVIPFMAVYDPSLMMQGGTWVDTLYMVLKAVVAIALWGGAAVGYLRGPLNWTERVIATGAAMLLVVALPLTDEIGFGLAVAFVLWHFWRSRMPRPATL